MLQPEVRDAVLGVDGALQLEVETLCFWQDPGAERPHSLRRSSGVLGAVQSLHHGVEEDHVGGRVHPRLGPRHVQPSVKIRELIRSREGGYRPTEFTESAAPGSQLLETDLGEERGVQL